MNKQKFVEYLRQPTSLETDSLKELESMLEEFPYFQNARTLIAKGGKQLKSKKAGAYVSSAAIYATDRALLKRYLNDQLIFLSPLEVHESHEAERERDLTDTIKTSRVVSAKVKQSAAEEKEPPKKKVIMRPKPESPKAEDILEDLTNPVPSDLDNIIEELYRDLEQLKVNRAKLDKIENDLAEQEAVDEAVKKATQKTSEPAEPIIPPTEPSEEPKTLEESSISIESPAAEEKEEFEEIPEPSEKVKEPSKETEVTKAEIEEPTEEVQEEIEPIDTSSSTIEDEEEDDYEFGINIEYEDSDDSVIVTEETETQPSDEEEVKVEPEEEITEANADEPQEEVIEESSDAALTEVADEASEQELVVETSEVEEIATQEIEDLSAETSEVGDEKGDAEEALVTDEIGDPTGDTTEIEEPEVKESPSTPVADKTNEETESPIEQNSVKKDEDIPEEEKPKKASQSRSARRTTKLKKESTEPGSEKAAPKSSSSKKSDSPKSASKKAGGKKSSPEEPSSKDASGEEGSKDSDDGGDTTVPSTKSDQESIIANFIKTNPSITPADSTKKKVQSEDLSTNSSELHPDIASEYLAEIYLEQGSYDRAIQIYEALIVRFPEKSLYFADIIKKINEQR